MQFGSRPRSFVALDPPRSNTVDETTQVRDQDADRPIGAGRLRDGDTLRRAAEAWAAWFDTVGVVGHAVLRRQRSDNRAPLKASTQ